jgi:hypothetical protein
MKYIMFQCKAEGKPTLLLPVIFPDDLIHKDVAEMLEHVKVQPDGPHSGWWMWPKAVSAGFFHNGVCYDRSESLNLAAHPEDTRVVAEWLAHGGTVTPTTDRVEAGQSQDLRGRRS